MKNRYLKFRKKSDNFIFVYILIKEKKYEKNKMTKIVIDEFEIIICYSSSSN
jgi:hypothetical protein